MFNLSLYMLSFIMPIVPSTETKIEVRGLHGELDTNVKGMVSTISTKDQKVNQRLKQQVTEAITKGLKAKGYYHPEIRFEEHQQFLTGTPLLVAHVNPGEPVYIEANNVLIGGDAASDRDYIILVQRQLPIKGEILDHGKYDNFRSSLTNLAVNKGYFNAQYTQHQLAVAPQLNQAFWNIQFDSGPRYKFGKVNFRDSQINEKYLQNLVPFKEGDYYDSERLSELNRRLSSTNWFASVVASPNFEQGQTSKILPIDTILVPRNKNIVSTGVGYSTDVGGRVSMTWTKPWINSHGHSTEVNTSLSGPEQSLDFSYTIPLEKNVLEHFYVLQAGYKREDQNDTLSNSAAMNISRFWNISNSWQRSVSLNWKLDNFTQANQSEQSMLFYPAVSLSRTRQRGGLMPIWGDSQRYSIDVSNTALGSDVDFFIFQAQNMWIRTWYTKHRFLFRASYGWIETNDFRRVPPSMRFFAGGDRSIRGYKYKSISPVNSKGQLVGGTRVATGSIEYQYNFTGKWWGAVFGDAGQAVNDFNWDDMKYGAGTGIRWVSPIGPIKFDIAKPIKDKDKNNDIQFYIGLGSDL